MKPGRTRLLVDAVAFAAYKHRRQRREDARDVAASPPRTWPLRRRRQYFDWARAVVGRMRGTHRRLERLFDEAYRLRP